MRCFTKTKNGIKSITVLLFAISVFQIGYAQQVRDNSVRILAHEQAGLEFPGSNKVYLIGITPRMVEFKENTVSVRELASQLSSYLKLGNDVSLLLKKEETDDLGMKHYYFKQLYKGLEVEGLAYLIHEKDGFVRSANGRVAIADDISLDVRQNISEEQAFQLALDNVRADARQQQTAHGKLLITSKDFSYTTGSFHLVYQFEIIVDVSQQWKVSIDARTGEFVNKESMVMTCFEHTKLEDLKGLESPLPSINIHRSLNYTTGTGLTHYNGTQSLGTEEYNGNYRLRGITSTGGLIETYDMMNQTQSALAVDFIDDDNNFTDPTALSGVSAHWATEQTFEYYKIKHNRNSFDNAGGVMKNWARWGSGYNNAVFWKPTTTVYLGDGNAQAGPNVSLDIVGHEWTHGVVFKSAELIYKNESGALDESFADIFGKCIEFYANPSGATWLLGADIYQGSTADRSLSNPNQFFEPDTYYGTYWHNNPTDNGGVHTNLGVQNFWFYLLSEGGSGINDHGLNYTIIPIGIENAAKIAYRNLTQYLVASSEYIDARLGSILAAGDLFGGGSAEQQSIIAAWDAVGVYDEPYIKNLQAVNVLGSTATLSVDVKPSQSNTSVYFEYGKTSAYGNTTSTSNIGNGNSFITVQIPINNLNSNTIYYYKATATNANGSINLSGQFSTNTSLPLISSVSSVARNSSATIDFSLNPNNSATNYYVEYGISPNFSYTTPVINLPVSIVDNPVTINLLGLTPAQHYVYRVVAANGYGQTISPTKSIYTFDPPVITGLAPTKAYHGETISISGSGFNPIPSSNIVTFGSVKAQVISATSTSLVVTVPLGAAFGPVSVINKASKMSAISSQHFNPIFDSLLPSQYFQYSTSLSYIFNNTTSGVKLLSEDIDGNGKIDILVGKSSLAIFNNKHTTTGSLNSTSFDSAYELSNINLVNSGADLDSDGKTDLITSGSKLSIFINTASNPPATFASSYQDLPLNKELRTPHFADFNVDGKKDFVAFVSDIITTKFDMVVFENINDNGEALAQDFISIDTLMAGNFGFPGPFVVDDLDGDNKPDILLAFGNQLRFYKNTSQNGEIDFNQVVFSTSANSSDDVKIADFNSDGVKDVIASDYSGGNLIIYEGVSNTPWSFKLPVIVIQTLIPSYNLELSDLNGDGRVDIIAGGGAGTFTIYLNKINSGNSILANGFESVGVFNGGNNGQNITSISLGDFNLDGTPDIVCTNQNTGCDLWENVVPICPQPPNSITISNLIVDEAFIIWSNVPGATTFKFGYAPTGQLPSSYTTTSSTYAYLNNLKPGTQYTVYVGASCTTENFSTITFTTPSYDNCVSRGLSTQYEHIDLVQISSTALSRASASDNGYFFSVKQPIITLSSDALYGYTLNYSAGGFTSGTRGQHWRAWIDFNRNGLFESTELIAQANSTSTGVLSSDFYIPSSVPSGITRMRVSMKYSKGSPAQTGCEVFSFGEVEDYQVEIVATGAAARQSSPIEEKAIEKTPAIEDETFIVYPNPVKDVLQIRGDFSDRTTYKIAASNGVIVVQGKLEESVDVLGLPPGVYVLLITDGLNLYSQKFVKR